MKILYLLPLFVFALFAFSANVNAATLQGQSQHQAENRTIERATPAVSTHSLSETGAGDENSRQIDRWLAMSDQLNNRLITIVCFVLGIVVTLAITFVGFNWFSNARNYERDKIALTSEIRSELKNEVTTLTQMILKQHETLQATLGKLVRDNSEIQKADLDQKIQNVITHFEAQFSAAKREAQGLKFEILSFESDRWEREGIHANSILKEIQRVDLANKTGRTWEIGEIIGRIEQLSKNVTHGGEWETALWSLFDKLPPEYASVRARIQKSLDAIAR